MIAAAAFVVAAAVVGFEVALLRILSIASYDHFAFLVITVALLGFAASGTFLALAGRRLGRRALLLFALATLASMPAAVALAMAIPVEARVVPALFLRQAARWAGFWAALAGPFFLGGAAVGLALLCARREGAGRVARAYAANLAGSAVGAVLGLLPPPPEGIRVDPTKDLAYVRRVGERVSRTHGWRGTVEVYRGPFRDVAFLGPAGGAAPPPTRPVFVDGRRVGSLLLEGSPALERTLGAFAYELVPERPRVLLLGEIGGAGARLAARRGAAVLDVVHPHGTGIRDDPRRFIDRSGARYDLIYLSALEGSAAGSGGLGGLAQDHLVTVEGVGACLARLTPEGVLAIARGIQSPPRDELKLLATIAEALRRRGADDPGAHLVVIRDFLGVLIVVRAQPLGPAGAARVRAAVAERELTPVFFPGVRPDELNRPDELGGPPGEAGDWLHHGAVRLLGPPEDAARFIGAWPFDIRPPTDDRPFFSDFCKLRSLPALRRAFGDLWPTRIELAFLFVLATIGIAAAAGALLVLLPPLCARRPASLAAAGYFGAIGLAYLLVEIAALSRLTRLFGDPATAAAATIAGCLFLSGLGALAAERFRERARLALAALLGALGLSFIAAVATGDPRLEAAALAPVALGMGLPMPLGLARLKEQLLPWAWGVNGFASVLAAPVATAIGMAWGFSAATALAVALYGLAALLFPRLEAG